MDRRNRSAFQNALPQRFHIFAVKRLPLRHHFIEHRAQAEQVRSAIHRLAANLLGRHVVQDRGNSLGVLHEVAHARYAETQNLYRAVPAAHDFGRLEAAVHHVVRRRVVEPAA